ncbi:MAG TPA: 4-hydroxy-3-methylbut-2-en-1-yl diphosphate synthase [Campylobacterales bacterium]|nr:4-hydroxy-3-methylbut-2-en-1-yl diphosphate synthase [Campylobacterales bacterium]
MSKINPIVWPIGIIASIMTIAGACVWTVKIAQSLPVEMDNTYFAKYQDVDENINEIIMSQRAFEAKYKINIEQKDFIIGNNTVEMKITDKQNAAINGATVDIVVTRPHTTSTDKTLVAVAHKNGIYKFEPFEVKELGRWQIQSRVSINDLVAYNKLEVNATN